MAGRMSGRVIFVKRCHALAPSTFAASCSSSGTSARPASRSSAMKGVVFQTSVRMITTSEPLWLVSGAAESEISGSPWTKPLAGSNA